MSPKKAILHRDVPAAADIAPVGAHAVRDRLDPADMHIPAAVARHGPHLRMEHANALYRYVPAAADTHGAPLVIPIGQLLSAQRSPPADPDIFRPVQAGTQNTG